MRAWSVLAVLSVSLLAGVGGLGCKGDRVQCEKAARNYATLVFWERTDAELAKLPAAERDRERSKRLSKFTNELESQIDFFIDQCVRANNDDQVDCMISAKTREEALKCAKLINSD